MASKSTGAKAVADFVSAQNCARSFVSAGKQLSYKQLTQLLLLIFGNGRILEL
ncbi:MAG: hypothetical protein R3F13_10935 [Prosthecobacter sp.]